MRESNKKTNIMFKNIFPDKLNGIVYKTGPEVKKATVSGLGDKPKIDAQNKGKKLIDRAAADTMSMSKKEIEDVLKGFDMVEKLLKLWIRILESKSEDQKKLIQEIAEFPPEIVRKYTRYTLKEAKATLTRLRKDRTRFKKNSKKK